MDQLITETNRALQRYHTAKTDLDAMAASKELEERHLPAFEDADSELHAYGVEMRATYAWMRQERARAAERARVSG